MLLDDIMFYKNEKLENFHYPQLNLLDDNNFDNLYSYIKGNISLI